METVRKINNDLAIARPGTRNQLHQIAEDGFKSVLNFRSPNQYLLNHEQQYIWQSAEC